MEINLLPIVNADGKKLELDTKLDFSGDGEPGVLFLSPVSVKGELVNVSGSIELKAAASVCVRYDCDRCCECYEAELNFEIDELLRKENSRNENDGNPDVVYFTGNAVELDEIIKKSLFMNLPAKRLCSDDCKGLCPQCGKNLNLGKCGCDDRPVDPRFDVLDKFFE